MRDGTHPSSRLNMRRAADVFCLAISVVTGSNHGPDCRVLESHGIGLGFKLFKGIGVHITAYW